MAEVTQEERYTYDFSDIPLIEYNNIYVGNLIWLERGLENDVATFDLVIRDINPNWGFYIFNGLERCLEIIKAFKYDDTAIDILKHMGLINSPKTEQYYRDFKFSGDVYALKEGTVFFTGEPIVRVTAPLIEANLLTAMLLNVFCYPVRILTKSTRCQLAVANSKSEATGGSVARLPNFDCAIESAKTVYLCADMPSFTPILFKKYPELMGNVDGMAANINHAQIKSFKTEDEAFSYTIQSFGPKIKSLWFMTDTYDYNTGVKKLIAEIKKNPDVPRENLYISIDSGDLYERAIFTRNILDENGLSKVRIQAYSNLTEYKIESLVKKQTPIDLYVAGTEIINITDSPTFEAVYKMAQLEKADGSIEQKAKLAPGKLSYPGKKQVFRTYDDEGLFVEDIVGLDTENLGEPLLKPFIVDGKQMKNVSSIMDTKVYYRKQLKSLPEEILKLHNPKRTEPRVSAKLKSLLEAVRTEHQ